MKTLGVVVFVVGIFAITSAEVSKCRLDLGLVVDTTKSIKEKNVPKLKKALQHLVQQFDISEDGTHISFETFAKESILHNKFNDPAYHSEQAILNLISNKIELSKPTRLDSALSMAKDKMFIEENGLRAGVEKVMVLYADGRSHPNTKDFYLDVIALKAKGVRLAVVGIGPEAKKSKYRSVLETIGGENMFFIDDYASLEDHTSDIMNMTCPPNPCKNSKGMDLAILVDRTRSLSDANYKLLKGFVAQLIDGLNIGRDSTHVGLIFFDSKAKVISTFADESLYTKDALYQLVKKISDERYKPTRTDKALIAANNKLFTAEGGDRPKFPNVLVILTDGKTNPASKPFAEITPLLKAKNVHLIAVGVGQYVDFQGQLEEIAGKNVCNTDNFDELSNLFSDVLKKVCSQD